MTGTPGTIMPIGIVLIDEPATIGITTFANGEVLMTINARPGGNCGQVIVGLTPNQAMELIRRLHAHDDLYTRAIAEGRGGAGFEPPS